VIEKVEHNFGLAQEFQELLVNGHFTEDEQFAGILNRYIFPSFITLKIEGILLAVNLAVREDIDRFLHKYKLAERKRITPMITNGINGLTDDNTAIFRFTF